MKEWKDLKIQTRNILERCWSDLSDNPTQFSISVGDELYGEVIEMEQIQEILEYQLSNPHFNVRVHSYDKLLIQVSGAYEFYSWKDADYGLTEYGKKEIGVGTTIYMQRSEAIADIHTIKIRKVTKHTYVLSDGTKIQRAALNEDNPVIVLPSEYSQTFYSLENKFLKEKYERLEIEREFEDNFDVSSASNELLRKLLEVIYDDRELEESKK